MFLFSNLSLCSNKSDLINGESLMTCQANFVQIMLYIFHIYLSVGVCLCDRMCAGTERKIRKKEIRTHH